MPRSDRHAVNSACWDAPEGFCAAKSNLNDPVPAAFHPGTMACGGGHAQRICTWLQKDAPAASPHDAAETTTPGYQPPLSCARQPVFFWSKTWGESACWRSASSSYAVPARHPDQNQPGDPGFIVNALDTSRLKRIFLACDPVSSSASPVQHGVSVPLPRFYLKRCGNCAGFAGCPTTGRRLAETAHTSARLRRRRESTSHQRLTETSSAPPTCGSDFGCISGSQPDVDRLQHHLVTLSGPLPVRWDRCVHIPGYMLGGAALGRRRILRDLFRRHRRKKSLVPAKRSRPIYRYTPVSPAREHRWRRPDPRAERRTEKPSHPFSARFMPRPRI